MEIKSRKFKAIIFDMDGVIVDSEPIHIKAERLICKKYGIKAPFSDWDKFRGWTSIDIFTYLAKNYGAPALDPGRLSAEKTEAYLGLVRKGLKLIPGFLRFLKIARKIYPIVGLATSSKKIIQEYVFQRFDLAGYFDIIITAEDIKKGKPDPEVFRKAVKKAKCKPAECLVVEDAGNGIIAAKKAGCTVLGITTSESRAKLVKAGADMVISKYDEFIYEKK